LSKRDEHDVADALLAKAVGDEAGLRVLADHPDVPDHVAGFLAQQAIEKSLKAVLTALGVLFERSHDMSSAAPTRSIRLRSTVRTRWRSSWQCGNGRLA
jgi:precorrin-6B methylase 1